MCLLNVKCKLYFTFKLSVYCVFNPHFNFNSKFTIINFIMEDIYNPLADLNGDEVINVIDVVTLVNLVLTP